LNFVVPKKDPDILVSSYQGLERNTISHLLARMSAYGFNLGGDGDKITCVQGRVCLDNKSFHSELDLLALIERARFGFLPLQLASRYGMNRLIDSRNCYEIIQRNFVIPSRNQHLGAIILPSSMTGQRLHLESTI
jgi:hypothetical protein